MVTELNSTNFDSEVLKSEMPVVVDFWATWCGPCRRLDDVIEDIAERYDGRVSFYRVDVNECGGTASRFAVRSIPTLLFFQEGEVVDQAVGSVSREDIEEKLAKLLGTA